MALTTLQFWQQQLAVHQAAQAAAAHDLAAAQAAQKAAADALAADLKTAATLAAGIAAQRARLALTTVPADAIALVQQITADVVRQRTLQGTLLDDQERLDAAGAEADAAAATQARAAARSLAAQAAVTAAQAEGGQRDALKRALAQPPLATLKADAAALLASPTASHAATRLGKNFPAELLAIAGKRHDSRRGRIAGLQARAQAAEDALGTGRAADEGLAGVAAQKQLLLQRAQAALADPVATSAARYARAQAVLAKLEAIELDTTGSVPDVLSAAEKAQLGTLAAAGAAAEPAAEAVDGDFRAIGTAEDARDAQVLTQIGTDVDQLATDPTVAAKRAAVTAAEGAFAAAVTAFNAADRKDLDAWEAVVPDAAWQVLLDHQEARADLTLLAATDLAGLAAAMDSAEGDYPAALAAAEQARRRADARADAIALRRARLADARDALAGRLPSAVRGDSY